jgi:hypothetical protein
MPNTYRIRVRRGDVEVEAESSDKEYVESKVDQYLASSEATSPTPVAADGTSRHRIPTSTAGERRPLSIGEFVKQVAPDKKNEIAATVAYFLEFFANQDEWKPEDVAGKFTDARKPKPANMTDLLAKSNFFMKGRESGFYRLSETGVQWIEGRVANAK